ncbi:ABC transporter, ATP-binding protein [Bacteriovorax sp. BSW11_IV]|uniref:ABC transporter ATP-binding protein n=1 Tax=Bacteriovorax sp. BSW11_IV TaxID=1353529 RepID=UPI00038A0DED|nr:ABC transporter ATP-binding protein [Bacteriovorax sp. BSW11_IV]EQC47065.1 ABC transporter, ATP-binding protein [Bacteriovorax sp. BSW11_IV]
MIKFNKISKSFKSDFWGKSNLILNDVSFEIESGNIIGFLGANGAGKTTTLKILMDFIKQDSGEVVFSKELGDKRTEINRSIGYLPEHPYFYPDLSGREFLKFLIELNDIKFESVLREVDEWTKKLKIDHALNRKIRSYSKGMLQRIGFVAAIIHKPKILILDEPLSGVDPVGRSILKQAMRDLNKEGTTIFFSSHIVADLEEVCNRVIILEKGVVIYSGDKVELLEKHSSGNYKVTYRQEDGLSITKTVLSKDKDQLILNLVNNSASIESLILETPSLEDVVYNLKK